MSPSPPAGGEGKARWYHGFLLKLVLGKQATSLFSVDGFLIFNTMNDNKITPKTVNEKELDTLHFWQTSQIFEKSLETPAGMPPKGNFTFYDGPPFATGLPHHGTLMAGTVKDLIPRYQTMKGNHVRRVWGWDCHGLPIENLIEKKLGLTSKKEIEAYGIDKFNHDAFCSVLEYEHEWKKIIPRLGRFVDMEHPYATMDATYTESIWWAWSELHKKGLAYEGYKMMHICPRCETPLAQSEVGLEYHDVTDLSVTAKFELVDELGAFVLAWTTTPWTLPGNTALALKKDAEYVKVSIDGMEGFYILAKERAEEVLKEMKYEVKETFLGEKLLGKSYKPVFEYYKNTDIENKENIWKIWHADFITLDTGTGIAHEAPAFGADDMELAKANNIPVIKHVKMDGTFVPEVTDFAGMKVKKVDDTQSADIEIVKYLAHHGLLFEKHKIIHSYPLCWRCKTPLLNYATSSWFVDVPKMKEKLISENKKVSWTPEHIRDGRFGKWLEGAREWAVSRTRYWGAPLPIWKNADGTKMKVISSLDELAEYTTTKPKNSYYVIRHGESESNVKGVIDCGGDIANALTEKGQKQAQDAVAKFDTKPDLIVSSPFLRTKQTAEIISKELGGVEVITDDRLKEFNIGIFDGKSIKEYYSVYTESDLDSRTEEGETYRELMSRTLAVWQDLEKKYEGKTILIVTHGAPGWILTQGLALKNDTEINHEIAHRGPGNWLLNAEPQKIIPKMVPRDETGALNLHRPYIDEVKLSIDGEIYTRIPDVFDCWFESGSMPFASLHYPFENKEIFDKNYPADFIAESMDQTRGWFYSLINLGVGLFDRAPYKHVICNGLINGADGLKLSKSLHNYTDPMFLIEKFGADAFRYYMMASPIIKGESVNFKDSDLEDVYKRIILRMDNVLSLYEMNSSGKVEMRSDSEDVLDRWIISRVHEVVAEATRGYDAYKIDEATRPIDQFVDDLSVWYVRRARSRLKGDDGEEIQTRTYSTLAYVLDILSRTIAPVMPFIAERMYTTVRSKKQSVHLESWPEGGSIDVKNLEIMKRVREVVSIALMIRTKNKISVRQPLQTLTTKLLDQVPEEYLKIISEEVHVKTIICDPGLEEDVTLDLTVTEELQREGDIRNLIRAVQDLRKEMSLSPSNVVELRISTDALGDLSEVEKVCKLSSIKIDDDATFALYETKKQVLLSFGAIYIIIFMVVST